MSIKNPESLKIAKATAEHDDLRVAIAAAEHILLVLKLMRDDPQGDHTSIPSTDPAEILRRRWQIVVSDMYPLCGALTEAHPQGLKFIFDTEDFADAEVEGALQ
jgi:hypothetical protein